MSGPILDPRLGDWTFDTSSIWHLDAGQLLGAVVLNMQGRVHLLGQVIGELPPGSAAFGMIPWYDRRDLTLPAHQTLYAKMRQAWGSAPGKDRGEAACIALAFTNAWRFVCDDRIGVATARSAAGLCVNRACELVVAMVRVGWITSDQGWIGVEAMIAAGRKVHPLPWADRPAFDALGAIATFDPCGFVPL